MLTKFWSENLEGRVRSEDPGVDGRIMLKWILEKQCGNECTGFIRLTIGARSGLL
jgi:hypothetical protein